MLLKKLELYPDNPKIFERIGEASLLDVKIKYWVIKELYFSPYKVYLNKLKADDFNLRFLKAKKYVEAKDTMHFINYFMKSLQEEFYKSKRGN